MSAPLVRSLAEPAGSPGFPATPGFTSPSATTATVALLPAFDDLLDKGDGGAMPPITLKASSSTSLEMSPVLAPTPSIKDEIMANLSRHGDKGSPGVSSPSPSGSGAYPMLYVVARGKQPGIYADWPSCQRAIGDAENPKYRKLRTRPQAVNFILEHSRPEVASAFLRSENLSPNNTYTAAVSMAAKDSASTSEQLDSAVGGLTISDNLLNTPQTSGAKRLDRYTQTPYKSGQQVTMSSAEPGPWTEWSGPAIITNLPGSRPLVDLLRHHIRAPCLASLSVMCSYIKKTGVQLLDDDFADLEARGIPVKLVTTTQLGITEAAAVQRLARRCNVEVRIFTSAEPIFHAKVWIFTRSDGSAAAVVGSSNLSRSGLQTSQEWNLCIQSDPAHPSPHDADLDVMKSSFQTLWDWTEHFHSYSGCQEDLDKLIASLWLTRSTGPSQFALRAPTPPTLEVVTPDDVIREFELLSI